MKFDQKKEFSGAITVFHTRRLPESAIPVGYAALIEVFDLRVPLPRKLSAIRSRHQALDDEDWRLLTPRHQPAATLEGHLTFALKYEGVDLAVLKCLFRSVGPDAIEELVQDTPTGGYARRIWFLYEWLLGQELAMPDAAAGSYVEVINTKLQHAGTSKTVTRQRVKNNVPGTPRFCPLVYRTPRLEKFMALDLAARARAILQELPKDLIARTAAFLLLKDSRSSFEIEGESPPHTRVHRWGQAIAQAGKNPINQEEILRLQLLVIADTRFFQPGLRQHGGFVGDHDRATGRPLPDHISARPEDLTDLVKGMIEFDRDFAESIDPVIAAAVLAFGFVYVHPLEDGNGRLHRYLIHHVLANRGFNPPGLVFPVSSAILESIDQYRNVLESRSRPMLDFVEWEPTHDNNIRVLNETADLYRYFDATAHAEFLYQCVQSTVDEDLPNEARFLRNHDAFQQKLKQLLDLPSQRADLLFRLLHQNNGKLSQRKRNKEFAALTNEEVEKIEAYYTKAFDAHP